MDIPDTNHNHCGVCGNRPCSCGEGTNRFSGHEEKLKDSEHIINGQFQSDKYPDCPRGLIPFKVTDVTAQPFLWEYAELRKSIDEQFGIDVQALLLDAGYKPEPDQPA